MFYKQYISVPNLKKCNNSHILNDDHIDKKHKHLAALNTILINKFYNFIPSIKTFFFICTVRILLRTIVISIIYHKRWMYLLSIFMSEKFPHFDTW